MFAVFKKRLYEVKKQAILMKGIKDGLIVDFEEELNDYLNSIEYNAKDVLEEFNSGLK